MAESKQKIRSLEGDYSGFEEMFTSEKIKDGPEDLSQKNFSCNPCEYESKTNVSETEDGWPKNIQNRVSKNKICPKKREIFKNLNICLVKHITCK